ncbi:MAG TPA: protein translocase subunit SecD [Gemmatimonadaceae bacterium]|nr:protein translocase subunit SecD [Gemmatimonadaceae bacterium]
MNSIRTRVLVILALVALAVVALVPRTVTIRRRGPDGVMRDTTYRRVPLKYGLDLQGGMYIALEVDESHGVVANKSEAIDRALTVVRNRIDQFGVAEPVVQKVGSDRIVVELPGIDDRQRAEDLVRSSAFLQFQITDKTQSLEKVMPRIDQLVRERSEKFGAPAGAAAGDTGAAKGALDLFTKAPDTAAAKGAKGGKGAKPAAPAADSGLFANGAGPFSKLIQQGGMPGEYLVAANDVPMMQRYLDNPEVQQLLPPGKAVHWGIDEQGVPGAPKPIYVVDARPIITGDYLVDAKPAVDPTEGNIVTFTLNNEGGRRFREETAKHVGDYMAIVLDDRVMGRPPVIQSAIGTRGQITMRGSPIQKVQDLALVLRAGALPVPLKVVESRTIGASLGKDSIRDGARAGIVGVLLVVVIMLVYYRMSGAFAVASLGLYMLWTLALLAGLDAVLTLPGLAGLVLSVGIAVDANVLIFERIREELAHGKSVRVAIDEGFKHAMSAIIDSNVSTALTALVLFYVGTGPVRGFAATLLAGIAASMVSSIFVVKTFFLVWLSRHKGAQTLSI